jgi:hypothetical protein
MKIRSDSYNRIWRYSNPRVIVTLNEDGVLYNRYRPSREGSSKRRANEDEEKTKSDTDDTNENTTKNKYTKYNVEIYENKSDEKTDNEKVDPEMINCPICYDNVKIPYVTSCNHSFCYTCIDKLITTSKNKDWACPICRTLCKK